MGTEGDGWMGGRGGGAAVRGCVRRNALVDLSPLPSVHWVGEGDG